MKDEVAGVVVKRGERCPRCGGPMFRKTCPCFLRSRGYATCAKCLNTRCAFLMGVDKKKRASKPRFHDIITARAKKR